MGINKQSARIKHHTSTTSGSFTVPASEDFTDGSWDKWDLAKSEIAVNDADDTVFIRVGSNIRQIYPQGASTGIFGISNGSGEYTFYTTIALANTAAVSGDVVEFFADVEETGATEWILKDGVNYNLNGHTYTLNNAGTSDAVTDNNVAVNCTIFNGTISRIGGSVASANTLTLHVDNTASKVYLEGVKVLNDVATACRVEGYLNGGNIDSPYYALFVLGEAENVKSYSLSSRAIYVSGGDCYDCHGYSDGFYGIETGGASNLINCTAFSSASVAIFFASGTGVMQGCHGYSSSNYGILMTTGYAFNCSAFSSGSLAMRVDAAAEAHNCSAYSTVNYAVSAGGKLYNCSFQSLAFSCVNLAGSMYNSSAFSQYNNSTGHAIVGNSADEVFNCMLEVTNASAYCLTGNASTVYYGENIFKGATTTVNTGNITQGQTNTPDTYGNILIG